MENATTTTEIDKGERLEKNSRYILLNKSTIQNPPYTANISKKLLCVEYPGIVENVDKAIETLGGLHGIETAVGSYNRRLELRYRPGDVFSKPCWGERDFNSGILVKIKICQQKKTGNNLEASCSNTNENSDSLTYHYDLVGITAMTFKFSRLCDFQYLPLVPTNKRKENASTSCQYIYEDIIPKNLPSWEWFTSKASVSMPFFFAPPIFSRFNSSKDNKLHFERYKYYESLIPEFAEKLKKDSKKKKPEPKNIITRSRSERKLYSVFINPSVRDSVIPTGPTKEALETLQRLALDGYAFNKIKELFAERPIWSKVALSHLTEIRYDRLKYLLPCVGYYFTSGPWRVMWCRFGFDPRVEPSARIYQTFDFRVRTSDGSKVKVQAKRSLRSIMHYRAGRMTITKFSLKDCSTQKNAPKALVTEDHYVLKPNTLPAARQMFYQYCDLHIPEIQSMLERLPEVPKGATFDPKTGWLPNGFGDQCREIANRYITDHVKTLLLAEKKHDEHKSAKQLKTENVSNSFTTEDRNLPSPILILDDDDDEGENPYEKNDMEMYSDGEENPLMDTDDEVDLHGSDNGDGDIDMEQVNEIDNIIRNIDIQSQTNDDRELSEDELSPELESLYHNLTISATSNIIN